MTVQNIKNKNKLKTLDNTMYTGAAHADVINAAVNVIMMSYTTYFYALMVVSHLFLLNIQEPGTI